MSQQDNNSPDLVLDINNNGKLSIKSGSTGINLYNPDVQQSLIIAANAVQVETASRASGSRFSYDNNVTATLNGNGEFDFVTRCISSVDGEADHVTEYKGANVDLLRNSAALLTHSAETRNRDKTRELAVA